MTRRDPGTSKRLKQETISDVLRDENFGIGAMINAMNEWMNEFSARRDFWLLRYESLRTDPATKFRALLARLGEATPEMSIFQDALEFSQFENMKKLEAAGAFESKILRAGDVRDPESFKVRRGKVGGYEEYLSAEDQQYAAEAMAQLDPRFGYETGKVR